jgi:hypothetical protein
MGKKTYFLDLRTLLTYLRDQSCELTTILDVSGKTARGSIALHEGNIVHCLLMFNNGYQIAGQHAYQQLEACTRWQVELERRDEEKKTFLSAPSPAQSTPFSGVPPPASASHTRSSPLLRQKKPPDPVFLQSLPMKDRFILLSVFTVIDGRHTVREIKAQLHFSAEDIDQALARLRRLDLIE